ncbi:hypothetical protein ACP70R_007461 [Stipagrostis hirtigluma subsp. patula]
MVQDREQKIELLVDKTENLLSQELIVVLALQERKLISILQEALQGI